MRIHHHFSIILCVAVVGAMGLVVAVGVLLGGVEAAAHEHGVASDQLEQVEHLVAESTALMEAVDRLTARSTEESFAVVDRSIEQSMEHLAKLRHASLVFEPGSVGRALEALRESRKLALERGAGVPDPVELQRFPDSVAAYARTPIDVETGAATAAREQARALARQRRLIMLIIGAICFAYLAAIERVRHWTTRHLIHPIQRRVEHGNTEELSTLATMLTSFGDTIKTNVRQRTAQVVRQKEHLETEVRVRRRAEEELRYGALRDKLTGLCNRDLILDRVDRCFERARRREGYDFALLVIDLDQYKEINDELGRFVGDQLLIASAERFKRCLREAEEPVGVEGSSLARLGGEEFAVLLDGVKGRSDATLVAERLSEALAEPLRLQGRDLEVSASVGIAFREDELDTAAQMLRNADAARYFAKAGGTGRYSVFKPGMHDQVAAQDEKGRKLRRALEHSEFRLAYQPIICLRTGCLVAFEALARWQDPQRGTISPVEFIPEAEESGVIIDLGRWVLQQACEQLRRWRSEFAEARFSVNVNVSRQQLVLPELVDDVRKILRSSGVGRGSLKLEITESVIMENPDAVTEALRRLRDLGVEIHMDDFGTGYSSLSYLHRLPIDVLKIDRAFMTNLSADNSYADVVHTVVALARTLRMRVTVEGVEAQEQVAQIKALDCDYAQGFYFSAPLSVESATKLVASDHHWLREAA
ncbi:MAG: putative bifunctional diguanylate cyclase/phosphodiesterase [Planctomycetota bacterium]|jgi:diguanylate cyclase (GGDEF)-like protein